MKFCNIFWTLLNKVNHETELIEIYIHLYDKCWSEMVVKQNNHITSFTTDRHSFNNTFSVVTNMYKVHVICVWTSENNGESILIHFKEL